ncbi:hypothetical protein JCM21714_157 [Gracilibacillus boraciitolerans JCM 21714]|uniref:Uncharacterized protein n=2 Tax=Gracilibacillus boraciitolerans TaxID=307521 RepID=W4VDF6_9BACI|nr:hypothetical protein JCM21714_157 [Gracilibacillus boraciitolerans JCM 21714]
MVSHFHHVLELEVQWSQKIYVHLNQVYFLQNTGDEVIVSFHNNKIRRQVNGKGHEELLRNINQFTAVEYSDEIVISILTNSGEQFEKVFLKTMEK